MSSLPKLVLDTNVLRDKDFIYWTQSKYHGKVCTSVVSYMELKRQIMHNKKNIDLDRFLNRANIDIISFTPRMASYAASIMNEREDIQCECCGKIDWADIMIYSTIENPPTILVTKNIKDFPDDRVMTPNQVIDRFQNRWTCHF